MNDLSEDPIINAINDGIRRSINVVMENKCYSAAVILIFAGIDAMSNIDRPENQDYNTASDFKNWVEKYFHVFGQIKITPDEWWAARNAIMHTYGAYSMYHARPGIRVLGWMVGSDPHIRFDGTKAANVAFVDIPAMRDAFFKGIEQFLIEGFADPSRKALFEKRLNELVMTFKVDKKTQVS
jgi:hypothetical protein